MQNIYYLHIYRKVILLSAAIELKSLFQNRAVLHSNPSSAVELLFQKIVYLLYFLFSFFIRMSTFQAYYEEFMCLSVYLSI
jgi:hypothetical protein